MKKILMALLLLGVTMLFTGCLSNTDKEEGSDSTLDAKRAPAMNVQLINAKYSAGSGPSNSMGQVQYIGTFTAYVKVKNLSFNKKVFIHYADGTEIGCNYIKALDSTYELWGVTKQDSDYFYLKDGRSYKFSIRYNVNNTNYWDNNNTQDYMVGYGKVNCADVALGDCNVYAYPGTEYNTLNGYSFQGQVLVKNLAYNKKVKVKYTTDRWQTFKIVDATYGYSGTASNLEFWNYAVNIGSVEKEILYCVSYEVNGVTHWDNNFGTNYKAVIAR